MHKWNGVGNFLSIIESLALSLKTHFPFITREAVSQVRKLFSFLSLKPHVSFFFNSFVVNSVESETMVLCINLLDRKYLRL